MATGRYIEKGANQHLDGYKALWHARSRWSTSDYSRMARQRCVIGAVVSQANPAAMALAFPQIAAAAKSNILTDVPLRDLKAWILLSERVKKGKVKSLAFTDAVIDTVNPDIQKTRELVTKAKDAAGSTATAGRGCDGRQPYPSLHHRGYLRPAPAWSRQRCRRRYFPGERPCGGRRFHGVERLDSVVRRRSQGASASRGR